MQSLSVHSPPPAGDRGFHLESTEFVGREVAACALFVQMKRLGHKNHLGVPCLPSPLLNNK